VDWELGDLDPIPHQYLGNRRRRHPQVWAQQRVKRLELRAPIDPETTYRIRENHSETYGKEHAQQKCAGEAREIRDATFPVRRKERRVKLPAALRT
jgi:hypothetical protein